MSSSRFSRRHGSVDSEALPQCAVQPVPYRACAVRLRAECGSPCQLCARRCPIQAIEPSGAINMDESFYCLDCQVIHNDATVCPPLVNEARPNRKPDFAAPTRSPAAE